MIKIKGKKKLKKFLKSLHGWKKDLVIEALSAYAAAELEKTRRMMPFNLGSETDGKE